MKFRKFRDKADNRWDVTDKMFSSLVVTGAVVEFSQVGASLIDGLVTSNILGSEAMAAIGIVHPVFSLLGILSGLIAVGMQIRCTGEIGRGNVRNMNRFFSASVIAGSAISLLMGILLLVFARPFAVLMGAKGNAASLADSAADYVRGLALGVPGLVIPAILAPALQLDSGRKTIRIGAVIVTAANILLDIAATFLGFGILGIALATSIANYLNLLFQCTHFLKKNRMLRFVKPEMSLAEFVKMLANGGEKAVRRAVNIIRPIILNSIIISCGGTMAMSALSIRNNFSGFAEIIPSGIMEAVSLLAGFYYGEVNKEAIARVGRRAHRLIGLASGLVCVLLIVFARSLAGIYVRQDGALKDMVVFAIIMLGLENPLHGLINSRIKYLQASRQKNKMNALLFSANLIFILVSAYLLGSLFGVRGILASFVFSDLLTLVMVTVFYQIKCRKPLPTISDYLSLPAEFDLGPSNMISEHVRNREDMALTSEQITLFCRGHGFSPRIGYYAALAFEELANNIITHGFPLNKQSDPVVDVRIVADGNRLILRLSDNCPRFDILKKIAEINEEGADPVHNIGLRITGRIAEDIRYASTFETNNIIIRYEDTEGWLPCRQDRPEHAAP